MRWERGHQSSDVDDLRGVPARGRGGTAMRVGGGGAVVVVLLAIVSQVLGVDVTGLAGGGGGGGGAPPPAAERSGAPPRPENDPDRELVEFVNFVIDDIQNTFAEIFKRQGKSYQRARLAIFTGAVDSGCGTASSAVGPFYCPPDNRAYIDLSFYRDLRDRFGAAGDFAQAYVLAHEIGHHLQNILGVEEQVRRQGRDNELSVRMELQADCFAGVWAHSTDKRKLLESGDVEEALGAAAAIGDDRLQKKAGVPVNAETWTHGSSDQRVRWFKRGLANGELGACDTFSADRL